MNAIVWNCRGAGNSRTVRDLDALVCRHNPKIVFLSETMISKSRVKNLRWRLGIKGCLAVDSRGKRGGIALFWDESIQVNLNSIEERYINVSIVDDLNAAPWRATFIYGEPHIADRHRMWEILQRLKTRSQESWVVIGDFNGLCGNMSISLKLNKGKGKWQSFGKFLTLLLKR